MQKTTLFGRGHTQATHPQPQSKPCPSCLKLQTQVSELTQLLSQTQSSLQAIISGSENELITQVHEELVDLREKYSALKKRVKQVEKDNDELFAENTRIEKQLTACRTQLRHYEETAEEAPAAEEAQLQPGEGRGESRSRGESQRKQVEIELFVWQEKVKQLQGISKEQGEQIVRLKEYLRKRNRQQAERHKLLQLLA